MPYYINIKYYLLSIISFVVSLVGINFHFGVTLYLSRLFLILIFLIAILELIKGNSIKYPKYSVNIFVPILFIVFILKIPSILVANSFPDALRQLFIYLSLISLFLVILGIGTRTSIINNGLKFFIYAGIMQGAYGIYQIIGPQYSWPTYQTIMDGIPTANDKTVGGYYWAGAQQMFRATGFFSADLNHYAIYLSTVFLISMAFIYGTNRRGIGLAGLFFSFIGIILSLSRSGLLSLFLFGIPCFIYLIINNKLKIINYLKFILLVIILLFFFTIIFIILNYLDTSIISYFETLIIRLTDLSNPGISETESMGIHIFTRMLGIDAFINSPLIGVGMGVNAAPWYSLEYEEFWAGSHSHHLNILGESGLIGSIFEWVFMYICMKFMYVGIKNNEICNQDRILLIGLFSSCITIIFGNMLYHSFMNDFVWYLMGIGVALSNCSKK